MSLQYNSDFTKEDHAHKKKKKITTSAAGRIFLAMGHIAHHKREEPWLNTLIARNAYNGTHLWKRQLTPGFMLHRNTLIATPETLYLGDDTSCKLLNAATGKLQTEIKIPEKIDPDGVWKWMALEKGILYAVVGEKEPLDEVVRGGRKVPGWPWSGLGKGYASKSLINIIKKLRPPFNLPPSAIAAGIAALNDDKHLEKVVNHNRNIKSWFIDELNNCCLLDIHFSDLFIDISRSLILFSAKGTLSKAPGASNFL